MNVPIEFLTLAAGAVGTLLVMWIRSSMLAVMKAGADGWQEAVSSIANSMATIASEVKNHHDRITKLEEWRDTATSRHSDLAQVVVANGARADLAREEIATLRDGQKDMLQAISRLTLATEQLASSKTATHSRVEEIWTLLTRVDAGRRTA